MNIEKYTYELQEPCHLSYQVHLYVFPYVVSFQSVQQLFASSDVLKK